jgi:L-lactate dehydrogenase complex protein LldE
VKNGLGWERLAFNRDYIRSEREHGFTEDRTFGAKRSSCSAIRGLGRARPSEQVNEPYFSKSRDLLCAVQGLELIEIDRPDECCGFGGSFCVADEAVSAKMGYDRVHDFHRHGAEFIASADMSCLMHMKGVIDSLKLPLKVIHIAQILNGGPL